MYFKSEKENTYILTVTFTNTNPKWIKELNLMNIKFIKPSEENIGNYLFYDGEGVLKLKTVSRIHKYNIEVGFHKNWDKLWEHICKDV